VWIGVPGSLSPHGEEARKRLLEPGGRPVAIVRDAGTRLLRVRPECVVERLAGK
jgi:hypothetical protein